MESLWKNFKVLVWSLFLCTAIFGMCFPTQAGAAEPIVLGAVGPLSSIAGRDSYRAVKIAVEEINAGGGVEVGGVKRLLKVVSADTRDNAPGVPVNEAILAYEKIILKHKPAALVVNCHRSEAMLASMDLIAKYKVPTFISISVSPVVDKKIAEYMKKGIPTFFHTSNNVIDWARAYASLMKSFKENGLTKSYGIYSDCLAFRGLWGMVEKGLARQGIELLGVDAVPIGTTDFSASLLKAKKKKTDILWTIYETAQIGILTKQWDALKVPGLLFVMAGPFVSQTAWKEYGDSLDGVLVQFTEAGGMPLKKYPKSTEFYEKCIKKWPDWQYSYGHSPGNSYDSVYLFANAIERAGTLDVGPLIKAIEETDRKGVTGRIKFDKHHKIIYGEDPEESAIMVFFQWQNGKAVPVSPPPIAEGKIILPSRMKK